MTSRTGTASPVDQYIDRLSSTLAALDRDALNHAIGLVESAWKDGRQVIVCGNGGSALTASHYLMDWAKMSYLATRRPFRGACLNDNLGLITAYSNDVSYQDVFVEQLKYLLQPGDLVIVVTGSGNSENVVRVIDYANANGGVTLAVCGFDGGKVRQRAKHSLWVNCQDMQIVEDVHLTFGHMVMKALCSAPVG